jgi:Na+/H+ antiporter NhaD/arsenite permease-like protein
MTAAKIYLIFLLTYAGMAAGRLPWFRIDRSGIALFGIIALLGTGTLNFDEINGRIDPPSLILLFALMIISEQFAASGFIEIAILRIGQVMGSPLRVLAATVAITGGLAALVTNDLLVLITTPLLIDVLRRRGLNPVPFLIAAIAADNAGSAATIIGAPQTILIGQLGDLRLPTYLGACGLPAIVALATVFGVVALLWQGRLTAETPVPAEAPPLVLHPHDRNLTNKAILALAGLLALFSTSLPHDTLALSIMALMMLSRKMTSRSMIAGVDWPLLILVYGLFGVTGALGSTALPALLQDWLQRVHLMPDGLLTLAPLTLLMCNTIGNVPFSILLLQTWQDPPSGALYGLALLSTLAGNLLLVGSLSNLLIVESAAGRGIVLASRDFVRAGVPITLISLGFAVLWLHFAGFMPWLAS